MSSPKKEVDLKELLAKRKGCIGLRQATIDSLTRSLRSSETTTTTHLPSMEEECEDVASDSDETFNRFTNVWMLLLIRSPKS